MPEQVKVRQSVQEGYMRKISPGQIAFFFTLLGVIILLAVISANLLADLGSLRPSVPAPGGSFDPASLAEWFDVYGPDSLFVVGGAVACADEPQKAAETLVSKVREAFV